MELERDLSLQNIAEEDLSLFTEPVPAYHPLRIAMCVYTRSHANSIFDSPMTRLPLTALPGRRINLVERIAFCPRPLLACSHRERHEVPPSPTNGHRLSALRENM